MKQVCLIIGTRPDAIKMAPVYLALKNISSIKVSLISTGQHRELLDQALEPFGIRPDIDLAVMVPGQTLSSLSEKILRGLSAQFQILKPDLVLGHGDTTTCFSAALSCFYQRIPFFHVEAGLRTQKLDSPFPEEFNRQCIAKMARFHFAPSTQERDNLISEGIAPESIEIIGNTIHDAIHLFSDRAQAKPNPSLRPHSVVMTLHRRENGEKTLSKIFSAISEVAQSHPQVPFIFPVHPSPGLRNLAEKYLGNSGNFLICDPLRYPEFLSLLSCARLVVTDSGGVQEEASFLKRPVFLLRSESERLDGLRNGLVQLIGTSPEMIKRRVLDQLRNPLSNSARSQEPKYLSASMLIAKNIKERMAS